MALGLPRLWPYDWQSLGLGKLSWYLSCWVPWILGTLDYCNQHHSDHTPTLELISLSAESLIWSFHGREGPPFRKRKLYQRGSIVMTGQGTPVG